MAKKKKIVRPHYVAKELRIKQAPKKPVPKELKWGILFGCIALVAAVIIFALTYNDGSLPQENNMPVTEGDNWLVANVGTNAEPKYYKVGEVAALDGFTLAADAVDQEALRMKVYTYAPDDAEGSRLSSYYVTGTGRKASDNAASVNDAYMSNQANEYVGPVTNVTLGGHEVSYFSMIIAEQAADTSETEGEQTASQQMLLAYLPAKRNTTVLVAITAKSEAEVGRLDTAQWEAILEDIVGTVTLEK